MKYKILSLLFVFCHFVFAQTNAIWNGYFSYNNIVALTQNDETAFASTSINYLKHNAVTSQQESISSINGIKSNAITDIYHSTLNNKTILANLNGLVIVVNESNKNISNLVGIVNKPSIPSNQKKINSISEFNNKIYLATEYGITELYLNTNLLGDTFIIGSSGENIPVLRVLSYNNYLYAITRSNGIKRANLNTSLVDYANWSTFDNQTWADGVIFNNQMLLSNTNGTLNYYNGSSFVMFHNMNGAILSLKNINNQYLIANTSTQIKIFDSSLNLLHTINASSIPVSAIKTSTIVNNKVIIGTEKDGLHIMDLSNVSTSENITPSGPEVNNVFRLKHINDVLWAVYGDYSNQYNPYDLEYYGISNYNKQTGWFTFPNSELNNYASISAIAINPVRKKEMFFGSFHQGLIKKDANDVFTFYDQTNSALEGIYYNEHIRIGAIEFDKNQNLWVLNTRATNAIKVLKPDGNWQNYSLASIATNLGVEAYKQVIIDRNSTKWFTTFFNGVIGFNENYSNKLLKIGEGASEGNLPTNDIRSIAIDHDNKLWIGTASGLRVLSSVDRFRNDSSLTTNPIIIMEDGLAQELFYSQFINDIEVDGSNNKWVSILESGVYHVSADGQKVLNRFTFENSPLPSNNVHDIEIDGATGEVFFATDKGLVSYKGTATAPESDLSKVYVYPNPVRPGFEGDIKISGLTTDAVVKITDIEGNLVFEQTSPGGTVLWDQRAFGKHKVASGVYMVFVSTKDANETKTKKIMIIR